MKVEEALDIAGDIVGTNNRTKEADAAVVLYQEVRALRKLLEIRTPISDSSTAVDIPYSERQYPTREDMRREIRRLTDLINPEGEGCLASPCDLIRAKNEERDWCCKAITDHLGGAYPDRAVAIIDTIHGATPSTDLREEKRAELVAGIIAWVQTWPITTYIPLAGHQLALELKELDRRVQALHKHDCEEPKL